MGDFFFGRLTSDVFGLLAGTTTVVAGVEKYQIGYEVVEVADGILFPPNVAEEMGTAEVALGKTTGGRTEEV